MDNKLFVIGLVLAVILVSGCAGNSTSQSSVSSPGASSGGGTKTISIEIQHTGYVPNTITVNKGDHVKFLVNTAAGTSTHHHGITIDEYGINQIVQTEDKNSPQAIEFDATKAGTFKIYCGTCKDGIFGAEHPKIEATLIVR